MSEPVRSHLVAAKGGPRVKEHDRFSSTSVADLSASAEALVDFTTVDDPDIDPANLVDPVEYLGDDACSG